jgi:hypothetical protein
MGLKQRSVEGRVPGKGSGISGMKWITVGEKEPTIFTVTCMLSSCFMNGVEFF